MQVFSVHFIRNGIRALVYSTLFLSAYAHTASAADILVSPTSGLYAAGESFTVDIEIHPLGTDVIAAHAVVRFDPTKLAVLDVSKADSVFSLWTTEPAFSNTAGTIELGGANPAPFSAPVHMARVTFEARTHGLAGVRVASGSVLAADDLGTDVYAGAVHGEYRIAGTAGEASLAQANITTRKEGTDLLITFGESSVVFADPEEWYATTTGNLAWSVPPDASRIALDISASPGTEPMTAYDLPLEQISLDADLLTDGVQYLTIQHKNEEGWGPIFSREIMVDSVPPQPFTPTVIAGNAPTDPPVLMFETTDELSGVDYYEVTVGNGSPVVVSPEAAKAGYALTDIEDGVREVTVVAYDKAGNGTESGNIILVGVGQSAVPETISTPFFEDFATKQNIAIVLLLLIILTQLMHHLRVKRLSEEREDRLRRETDEVQDQMEKIFSALRDEIHDQISMITKRERLSKKEKEAVGGLYQALEVSEKVLEKEIVDVSTILAPKRKRTGKSRS